MHFFLTLQGLTHSIKVRFGSILSVARVRVALVVQKRATGRLARPTINAAEILQR